MPSICFNSQGLFWCLKKYLYYTIMHKTIAPSFDKIQTGVKKMKKNYSNNKLVKGPVLPLDLNFVDQ